MRYLCLIKHSEKYRGQPIPQGLMGAMGEFVGDAMKRGVITDTAGLKGSSEGCQVQLEGGKMRVVDGPFSESKEIIGGYAMMNVESKAEALALAEKFVDLHRIHWPGFDCMCEVRPLEDFDTPQ